MTHFTKSNDHLSHEQICDLLLDPSRGTASATHLESCSDCAEEFSALSASLHIFQLSSRRFAESELARRPERVAPAPRRRSMMAIPAYVTATAIFLGAVLIPLRLHHAPVAPMQPSTVVSAPAAAQSSESDEALLEEINQDLSASIPSPMEPLADPTSSGSSAQDSQ